MKVECIYTLVLYKTGIRIQKIADARICDIQLGRQPKVALHGNGQNPNQYHLGRMQYFIYKNIYNCFIWKKTSILINIYFVS